MLTANRRALKNPNGPIVAASARLGKTAEQIVFRFALQIGILPLTGTTDATHMRQDLDAFDFELTAAEVTAIERHAVAGDA